MRRALLGAVALLLLLLLAPPLIPRLIPWDYPPSASPAPDHVTAPLGGWTTTNSTPFPLERLPPDDRNTLVDLPNFSFLRVPTCHSSNSSVLPAVAIVHSAPANAYHRRQIRATWGSEIPVFFMLGDLDRTSDRGRRLVSAVEVESLRHGDIVQGSFIDSYRNLTYKHVMGLKWATYNCPKARYILKTDDDVFVNTRYLLELLEADWAVTGGGQRRGLLMCNVMPVTMVKRTYRSKWRVSPKEYPGRWYPQYCTGWALLYSPDVAFTLYRLAQATTYFWIDDVHITGTLVGKTDIHLSHLGQLSILWGPERGPPPPLKQNNHQISPSSETWPHANQFLFALTTPDYLTAMWHLVNHHQGYHKHQSPSSHLMMATTTSRMLERLKANARESLRSVLKGI